MSLEHTIAQTGVHFHETRGMGVANVWAAIDAGIRRFDASVGGIGGLLLCARRTRQPHDRRPCADATQSGLHTGIDLRVLLPAISFAEGRLQNPLGGRSIQWLRRGSTDL